MAFDYGALAEQGDVDIEIVDAAASFASEAIRDRCWIQGRGRRSLHGVVHGAGHAGTDILLLQTGRRASWHQGHSSTADRTPRVLTRKTRAGRAEWHAERVGRAELELLDGCLKDNALFEKEITLFEEVAVLHKKAVAFSKEVAAFRVHFVEFRRQNGLVSLQRFDCVDQSAFLMLSLVHKAAKEFILRLKPDDLTVVRIRTQPQAHRGRRSGVTRVNEWGFGPRIRGAGHGSGRSE